MLELSLFNFLFFSTLLYFIQLYFTFLNSILLYFNLLYFALLNLLFFFLCLSACHFLSLSLPVSISISLFALLSLSLSISPSLSLPLSLYLSFILSFFLTFFLTLTLSHYFLHSLFLFLSLFSRHFALSTSRSGYSLCSLGWFFAFWGKHNGEAYLSYITLLSSLPFDILQFFFSYLDNLTFLILFYLFLCFYMVNQVMIYFFIFKAWLPLIYFLFFIFYWQFFSIIIVFVFSLQVALFLKIKSADFSYPTWFSEGVRCVRTYSNQNIWKLHLLKTLFLFFDFFLQFFFFSSNLKSYFSLFLHLLLSFIF